MDTSHYKKLTTSRGFTYSYYRRAPSLEIVAQLQQDPAEPALPALLFLHGFPTSSRLWKHQVEYFQARGFFVCAPDLLGFGGTSKPTDPEVYRASLICKDIVEIMDEENMRRVIVIGHDLGSKIASRLANFYPERFLAYAFLAVPYSAPRPLSKIDHTLRLTKKMCGYELCGHVNFFAEDDTHTVIEGHLDSFFSALFPNDPKIWVTQVAPIGALKSWLERDAKLPMAPYIQSDDIAAWRNMFVQEGCLSACCWYKALVSGINADDDKPIPLEKYPVDQPVFFAAAFHDYISPAVLSIAIIKYHCKYVTVREFQDGHWLMMSSPREVNAALFSWIMDCIYE
ncbi:alpha/beta-hydrolase [Pholiota conissans]|uniref:Alpha/beta-hydrolase n=1 Tax=Pholiota conissans TaxID=109636 RepID=A0A9P5YSW4_9AGAR|nr:alpha/beta-hydrolase [Pholiota conissans]